MDDQNSVVKDFSPFVALNVNQSFAPPPGVIYVDDNSDSKEYAEPHYSNDSHTNNVHLHPIHGSDTDVNDYHSSSSYNSSASSQDDSTVGSINIDSHSSEHILSNEEHLISANNSSTPQSLAPIDPVLFPHNESIIAENTQVPIPPLPPDSGSHGDPLFSLDLPTTMHVNIPPVSSSPLTEQMAPYSSMPPVFNFSSLSPQPHADSTLLPNEVSS